MVQRYELEEMSRNPFESYRCMEENEDGDYVKYEDYEKLKRYADSLATEVAKFEAGERAFLGHALFAYRNIND